MSSVLDPLVKKIAAFTEIGRGGVSHNQGVLTDEFLRELQGQNGIKVFREMSRNDAVIGASLFAYTVLAKEVEFRIDSAQEGEAKSDEIQEFVRGALFDDMNLSFRDLLGEIFTFLTYGWSYFEIVYKRRMGPGEDPSRRSRFNDNRIGWRKWAPRPQESLDSWIFDEAGGVNGMVQRPSPTYERIEIPIEKALLFRTSVERGSPEGISILRTAYTSWYYKRRLAVIRGIGVERDLAGLPVLTPPEGSPIWDATDATGIQMKTRSEALVRSIRRDEHEGIVKPFGWTLELLSSSGGRQFDITGIIAQLNTEIAMSMMTDFLLVGHEKVGARSMREDARDTFSHAANSFLDNICDVINRFAIPKLVQLNGWPLELAPTLAHGPVAEISLSELITFVQTTVGAGVMVPDPNLEQHLRKRANLPPAPEEAPEAMPRQPRQPRARDRRDPADDDEEAGVVKGGAGSGDLPGHEFRGNQWTGGSGGGTRVSLAHKSEVARAFTESYRKAGHQVIEPSDTAYVGSRAARDSDSPLRNEVDRFVPKTVIAKYENDIRNQATETAVVVDSDGHVIGTWTSNKPDSVEFGNEDRSAWKDAVLTHNHPGSIPLSTDDARCAVSTNLREIRAVTQDGTFRLARTSDLWPPTLPMAAEEAVQNNYAEVQPRINALTDPQAQKQAVADANFNHWTRVWNNVSKEYDGEVLFIFEPRP